MSGTVTVKTELAPARPTEPEAWIELSEVRAIYNHRAPDGRITPLRVSAIAPPDRDARTAVSVRVTPQTIELACKDPGAPGGRKACTTRIGTPLGILEVRGHAQPQSIAIAASGTLDLALLRSLVDATFEEIGGRAQLTASIGGTLAAPRYEASLELAGAMARLLGTDTDLEARAASSSSRTAASASPTCSSGSATSTATRAATSTSRATSRSMASPPSTGAC